ncbi:hypothetical protein M8J77_024019 [Diaphorina citri]|nr:hypothetical protein M8J77_024019 [Diaphorina citri]
MPNSASTSVLKSANTPPTVKDSKSPHITAFAKLSRYIKLRQKLPMCEELRRALYANPSLDLDLFVPDLNGVTEILTDEHRKQLCRHLPARAEGKKHRKELCRHLPARAEGKKQLGLGSRDA